MDTNTIQYNDALNRINTLMTEGRQVLYDNPMRASELADQALALLKGYEGGVRAAGHTTPEPDGVAGVAARLHFLKADACSLLCDYTASDYHAKQMLMLAETIGDVAGQSDALSLLGTIALNKADLNLASDYQQRAFVCFEQQNDLQGIGRCLHEQGKIAFQRGDYTVALKFYEQSGAVSAELGDTRRIVLGLLQIGETLHFMGKHTEAVEQLLAAEEILGADSGDADLSPVYCTLGNCMYSLGRYSQAVDYLLKSLKISEEHGYKRDRANALMDLGSTYYQTGDYPAAIDQWTQAADIYLSIDDHFSVAKCMNNIGTFHVESGNRAKGIEFLKKALDLKQKSGLRGDCITTLFGLGLVYKDGGNLEAAEANLRMAVDIAHELHSGYYGNCLTLLSDILLLGGKYQEAQIFATDALEITRESGNRDAESQAWNHLGTLYSTIGDQAMAVDAYTTALEIAKDLGGKYLILCVYDEMVRHYKRYADCEQALHYLELLRNGEKELFNEQSDQRIQELTVQFEVAQKEREAEIQRLRVTQLESEVERQRRQLSDKTLQLVQQTEALQQFRRGIDSIVRQAESAEKAIRAVRNKLKDLPETVMNWATYLDQFRAVHPDFEAGIRRLYPALTHTEIKVCCLLRIGMSSRDMATLLFVSERTVENHRLHIRKKLNLPEQSDLGHAVETLRFPDV